jgi:hypothetical protein
MLFFNFVLLENPKILGEARRWDLVLDSVENLYVQYGVGL